MADNDGVLWRITHRGVCAGLIVRDGVVVECAPILRKFVLNRPWHEAKEILRKKGYHGEPLFSGPDLPRPR